jgi:hypothetical protein
VRKYEPPPFNLLIENYCRAIGMGDLEVGPDGGLFELGDVEITVMHDVEFKRLSMLALVTTVPPDNLPALLRRLMQLNLGLAVSGRQAFCADAASGEVSLQQSLPLRSLDSEDMDACLSTLAAKTRAARDLLAGVINVTAISDKKDEEATQGKETGGVSVVLRG